MQNSSGSVGKRLFIISAVLFLPIILVAAIVYMLLAPIWLLFGNPAIGALQSKYSADIVQYVETEQIGIYPLPSQTSSIASDYGSRNNPISGIGDENHTGIDFATPHHSPVVAIADGTVVKTGADRNFGKYILIRHEDFYTFYAHLSRNYSIKHQEVSAGQVLGLEGGDPESDPYPGRSTGHHLHFEIRTLPFAWSHVDPHPYILDPPPEEDEDDEDEEGEEGEEGESSENN